MRRKVLMVIIIAFVISIIGSADIPARIIRVPSDYPKIQYAINSANLNDTVLISAGSYAESLTVSAKPITLIGERGADSTLITGSSSRGLTITYSPNAFLKGISLTGADDSAGGAIFVANSVLGIDSCCIRDSHAGSGSNLRGYGGGIFSKDSRLRLSHCLITNNEAYGGVFANGGGVYSSGGKTEIDSCTISGNIASAYQGVPSSFQNNGGGISCNSDSVTIIGNRFSGNRCWPGDAVGGGLCLSGNCFYLKNNTFFGNSLSTGHKYTLAASGGGVYITGNDGIIIQNQIDSNSISTSSGSPTEVTAVGAGLFVAGDRNSILENIFSRNSAQSYAPDPYGACGGDAKSMGGGCWISGASSFLYNILIENIASATAINDCFSSRYITSQGGGVYFNTIGIFIRNNTMVGNLASAIASNSVTQSAMTTRAIGGGCYMYNSVTAFTGNLIVGNKVTSSCQTIPDSALCTQVSDAAGVYALADTVRCNLYYGNTGAAEWSGAIAVTNVHKAPLFCDTLAGNYHPQFGSPCDPNVNGCRELIGALEPECSGPQIISVFPARNCSNSAASDNVAVTFDMDMADTTITSSRFIVNGSFTGRCAGAITYDNVSRTASFNPAIDFLPGEIVTATLTQGVKSAAGTVLIESNSWTFAVRTSAGMGIFKLDTTYSVGNSARSVSAGDFDGDGEVDLAATSAGDNKVVLFYNDGYARFDSMTTVTVPGGPYAVVTGDFDGDYHLDLATANYGGNSVSILLNNGSGHFGSPVNISNITQAYAIRTLDIEGDGDLDLIVADEWPQQVSLLVNDGHGNFVLDTTYTVGDGPRDVCVADFDNDGDVDLATADSYPNGYSVTVYYGDGGGRFVQDTVFHVGGEATSVAAGDMNNDGWMELAAGILAATGNIKLFSNDSGSLYGPLSISQPDEYPRALAWADIDGDGYLDLAAANWDSSHVAIFRNSGGGGVSFAAAYDVDGANPKSLCAADLNGDGQLDLVSANATSGTISVLLQRTTCTPTYAGNPCDTVAVGSTTVKVSCPGEATATGWLYYRLGGKGTYAKVSLIKGSGDTLQYSLPPAALTVRGLEYYFEIMCGSDTYTLGGQALPHSFVVQMNNQQARRPTPVPRGLYRIVSVPVDMIGSNAVTAVFPDDLGSYDITGWRLGSYDPATDTVIEYPDAAAVVPGQGYWLYVRGVQQYGAAGYSVRPNFDHLDQSYYAVPLRPGWNQVGNPFAFDLDWEEVLFSDNGTVVSGHPSSVLENVAYWYSGVGYNGVSVIPAWEGFFVYVNKTGVEALFPYRESGAKAGIVPVLSTAPSGPAGLWEVEFRLETGGFVDDGNYAGVRSEAQAGPDEYDFSEPPPPPGTPYLAFHLPEAGDHLRRTDFRPPFPDGADWDLVASPGVNRVLVVRGTKDLPQGLAAWLAMDDGSKVLLSEGTTIQLPDAVREMKLYVGTEAYLCGRNSLALPTAYALEQNYPNPFNHSTTIRLALPEPGRVRLTVYNILGQRVAPVLDGEYPAGYHVASWDGTDGDGRVIGSGVYIYRLVAGSYSAERKMVMLK